jgi:hypothetical protein
MPYPITTEIKARASKAGVIVKPSNKKDKKLDAFDKKTGKFQTSFGQAGAKDYHLWKDTKGKTYAEERRRLYHIRHKNEGPKEKNGKLTASYLAKKILW